MSRESSTLNSIPFNSRIASRWSRKDYNRCTTAYLRRSSSFYQLDSQASNSSNSLLGARTSVCRTHCFGIAATHFHIHQGGPGISMLIAAMSGSFPCSGFSASSPSHLSPLFTRCTSPALCTLLSFFGFPSYSRARRLFVIQNLRSHIFPVLRISVAPKLKKGTRNRGQLESYSGG